MATAPEGSVTRSSIDQSYPLSCGGSEAWLKILTSISLIVSAALLAFLICYHVGVFHFEQFIGPIGPISTITGVSTLVILSLAILGLSFKK